MDLAEDTALEVFVALEGKKKRSWKENKKLKKKDRRRFADRTASSEHGHRQHQEGLSCKEPYQSKAGGSASGQRHSASVYLGQENSPSLNTFVGVIEGGVEGEAHVHVTTQKLATSFMSRRIRARGGREGDGREPRAGMVRKRCRPQEGRLWTSGAWSSWKSLTNRRC